MTRPAAAAAANPRRWLVLIAMTASLSMILLDGTVVAVALPSLRHDLGFSASGVQWVVNAYVLALASLVAFAGRLGDTWGRVRAYRLGVVVFFVASALCALTPSGSAGPLWLIGWRAVQGIGAAFMTPTATAIVAGEFELRERGRALALYNGIGMVFLALGPLLGGILIEAAGWPWIFWINVPIGLAALALLRVARPANHPVPGRLRPASLALLVTGLVTVVLGLQEGGVWGWTSPATLALIAGGIAVLLVFGRAQLRYGDPLIELRLFRVRAFRADSAVIGLLQFGLLPVVVYAPLFLQNLLGMSPLAAGAGTLPFILALAGGAQIAGRWLDRSGVRAPVLTGMSVATIGLALWAASLGSGTYAWQLPGMVVAGAGVGLSLSPSLTDVLNRSPAAKRGQGAGIAQTMRQLAGSVGLAVAAAVVLGVEAAHATDGPGAAPQIPATMGAFALAAAATGCAALVALIGLPRGRQQATVDDIPAAEKTPTR